VGEESEGGGEIERGEREFIDYSLGERGVHFTCELVVVSLSCGKQGISE